MNYNNYNNLVSVIIPTYKRSDMLCIAIDSVLNQSYENVEVVVVDDNDPNTEWRLETEKRLMSYSDNNKVKYIKHEKNRNGSAARNTGIKHSNGEFLCFLDDDDYYYPDKIEKQVIYIKENNLDACYCDYKKNGVVISVNEQDDVVKNILLAKHTPQTSGWMITREAVTLLNGFDESYYRHQDYEFLLRFYSANLKMGKLDQVLYERKVSDIDNHPSGEKTEEIKKKLFNDFSYIIDDYVEKDPSFRKELNISAYTSAFKGYYRSRDFKNCLRLFVKSLACSFFGTIHAFSEIVKSHL